MEHFELILSEIRDINKTTSGIRADLNTLAGVNKAQHSEMEKTLTELALQVGDQNGRVTRLEHFKTTILTKVKVIPATISTIFGVITVAITMYLKAKG